MAHAALRRTLRKTAKGGAASVAMLQDQNLRVGRPQLRRCRQRWAIPPGANKTEVPASYIGPSSGVARFACDSASSG
jgi:hypothetical protein